MRAPSSKRSLGVTRPLLAALLTAALATPGAPAWARSVNVLNPPGGTAPPQSGSLFELAPAPSAPPASPPAPNPAPAVRAVAPAYPVGEVLTYRLRTEGQLPGGEGTPVGDVAPTQPVQGEAVLQVLYGRQADGRLTVTLTAGPAAESVGPLRTEVARTGVAIQGHFDPETGEAWIASPIEYLAVGAPLHQVAALLLHPTGLGALAAGQSGQWEVPALLDDLTAGLLAASLGDEEPWPTRQVRYSFTGPAGGDPTDAGLSFGWASDLHYTLQLSTTETKVDETGQGRLTLGRDGLLTAAEVTLSGRITSEQSDQPGRLVQPVQMSQLQLRLELVSRSAAVSPRRYQDPLGRFSLELPQGWEAEPTRRRATDLTWSGPDGGTAYLLVQEVPADQDATETLQQLLDNYSDYFGDGFQVLAAPVNQPWNVLLGATADYVYPLGDQRVRERSLALHWGGRAFILQFADNEERFPQTQHTLEELAAGLTLGPLADATVAPEALAQGRFQTYEHPDGLFQMEVSEWWLLDQEEESEIAWAEMGGQGRLWVSPEATDAASALAVLQGWIDDLDPEGNIQVVEPVRAIQLGEHAAATVLTDWTLEDGRVFRQRALVTIAGGVLYAVYLEYPAEGYQTRKASLERMLFSFRPQGVH